MSQPSPWILLIGGGALLNVSLMIGGAKAPAWLRYPGMALCAALGLELSAAPKRRRPTLKEVMEENLAEKRRP